MKKVEGLEPAVRHKEAISDADRELLEHYFDDVLVANDPVKLTMYVWLETTLHFGLRGREVQVQMTKKDRPFCNDKRANLSSFLRTSPAKTAKVALPAENFQLSGACKAHGNLLQLVCFFKSSILMSIACSNDRDLDE